MELARLTSKLRTLEDKERATAGVAGFREYILCVEIQEARI